MNNAGGYVSLSIVTRKNSEMISFFIERLWESFESGILTGCKSTLTFANTLPNPYTDILLINIKFLYNT